MGSLKEIRTRISSVDSTKQITSAMKMVSAAKLRKAQDAITNMRPYAEKLEEILINVSQSTNPSENVYAKEREIKNVLIVPVSSNRGLCGAFNANIVKSVISLSNNELKNYNLSFYAIGRKSAELLHAKKFKVERKNFSIFDKINFENSAQIALELMKDFADSKYDKIIFIYNKFRNAAVQDVTIEQFLPIKIEHEAKVLNDYIYEPERDEIIHEIIPKSLKTKVFKIILDTNASEHGARMTAMHKATDNATALGKELLLQYNKARQASITNEILEIVGGAEALKS